MIRLIILGVLILVPSRLQAQQLVRVSMEDIVEILRQRGVPVSFERFPNTKDDAISLKKQIELLEAIPLSKRTVQEKNALASCLRLRKEDHQDSTIVNWRLKRFDVTLLSSGDTATTLKAAVSADPDYEWKLIGRSYVVYPQTKSFSIPIKEFTVINASFDVLIQTMIELVAKPAHLNYMEVYTGPGPSLSEMFKDKRFSISLTNTDTRKALCAITESLGYGYFWTALGGADGSRNLGFGRARSP